MKIKPVENQRKAIIWGRFSSDKQGDGDSRDRQDRLNRALAVRENIKVLAEHFDPASSVKDGATPLFKKVVAELPNGIGIICENLDRISRGHPWRAKAYIADILEAGHFIITSQDGREYNNQSIEDIDTMVLGDMASNVARYENNKRTKRVREEKTKAIELVRQGKAAPLGAWIPPHLKYNPVSMVYDIVPDRLKIVKYIFAEYVKGHGVTGITKALNLDGTKTFRGKKVGKWMKSTIFTMLRYEGLIGVLNYKGERIPNAFPPAITEKIFYQVQGMLEVNKARHGNYASKRVNNIFRGICQCAHCGNTMRVTHDNYIACNGYQVGQCKVKNMMKFGEMEYEFAKWFIPQAKNALLGKDNDGNGVKSLETKKHAIQTKLEATIDLLDAGVAVNEIKSRLVKLEGEKNAVENELATLKAEQSTNAVLPDTLNQLDALIDGIMDNQEVRKKVASLVPSIVKVVKIDIADKWFPSFTAELVNGKVVKWQYHIAEFAEPIKGIAKDGSFILGKGKVLEGSFERH